MDRTFARLLPLTLLLAGPAFAGPNSWTSIGPEGGSVWAVEFHPTDPTIVYAASPSGLYRSVDTGNSWQLLKEDFAHAPLNLAVSPGSPNRVLIAATDSAYVSNDRGTALAPYLTVPSGYGYGLALSRDGQTAYYGSGTRVHRSTNGGGTWQAGKPLPGVAGDYLIHALDIDPVDSKVVYAAVRGFGIFRSADGGESWQLLGNAPPEMLLLMRFAVDPTNGQRMFVGADTGLYFSSNGGTSWAKVSSGFITDIDFDPANAAIVYATSDTDLKKSTDGGQQWTTVTQIDSAFSSPRLSIAASRSSLLALHGGDGVKISEDGGAHWSTRNKGLLAAGVLGFAPGTGRIYAAARASGIYSVASGSSTVVPLNNAALVSFGSRPLPFDIHFATQPGQPDTLFATIDNETLVKSMDGGASWNEVSVPSPFVMFPTTSPREPQTVYVVGEKGVYRSTDGGIQWVLRSAGLPERDPISLNGLNVLSAGARAGLLYAANHMPAPLTTDPSKSRIYRTTDAGVTWTAAGPEWKGLIYSISPHPLNDQVVYAGIDSYLQKSTDGGTTWSQVMMNGGTICCSFMQTAFDPANPKIIYAVSITAIFRSVDDGATWQPLERFTPDVSLSSIAFDAQSGAILVATAGMGIRQMTVAPDIEVSLAPPTNVAPNVATSYGVNVRNSGPYDATNVRVTVQLPAGTNGITASGSGATCSVATTSVACIYEILRASSTNSVITMSVTPTATGAFTVSASATSDQPDAASGNNSASGTLTVATPAPPAASSGGGGGSMSLEMLATLSALLLLRGRRVRVNSAR